MPSPGHESITAGETFPIHYEYRAHNGTLFRCAAASVTEGHHRRLDWLEAAEAAEPLPPEDCAEVDYGRAVCRWAFGEFSVAYHWLTADWTVFRVGEPSTLEEWRRQRRDGRKLRLPDGSLIAP